MNKLYIVTAVDTSETASGKACVLGAFKTEDEAKAFVRYDMESYVDDRAEMNLIVDFDKMSTWTKDHDYGCEWNIWSIEVQ